MILLLASSFYHMRIIHEYVFVFMFVGVCGVKCWKEVPTHVLDTYRATFSLLLYEDVSKIV